MAPFPLLYSNASLFPWSPIRCAGSGDNYLIKPTPKEYNQPRSTPCLFFSRPILISALHMHTKSTHRDRTKLLVFESRRICRFQLSKQNQRGVSLLYVRPQLLMVSRRSKLARLDLAKEKPAVCTVFLESPSLHQVLSGFNISGVFRELKRKAWSNSPLALSV